MKTEERQLILGALDSLAVALASHEHVWTTGERAIYEEAITALKMECVERIAIPALKLAYGHGHYCDNMLEGKKCPGCEAGLALEKITGRPWTQEECE